MEVVMSLVSLIRGVLGVEFCVKKWPVSFGEIEESGQNMKNYRWQHQ